MIEGGWKVFTRCQACGLLMQTPLDVIAKLSGRKTILWGLRKPCRRYQCGGRVWFEAYIPELAKGFRLDETKITPVQEVIRGEPNPLERFDVRPLPIIPDPSVEQTVQVALLTMEDRKQTGFSVRATCGCRYAQEVSVWSRTLADHMDTKCRQCGHRCTTLTVTRTNVGRELTLGRLIRAQVEPVGSAEPAS